MNFFNKIGHYIIIAFNLVGMLILFIPKIPDKLRNIDSNEIRDKIDTENLKNNISYQNSWFNEKDITYKG